MDLKIMWTIELQQKINQTKDSVKRNARFSKWLETVNSVLPKSLAKKYRKLTFELQCQVRQTVTNRLIKAGDLMEPGMIYPIVYDIIETAEQMGQVIDVNDDKQTLGDGSWVDSRRKEKGVPV
jgi:hypothetical protein